MSTCHYHGICVTNQPHPKPVLEYKESISTFPVQERSLQDDDDEKHCQCEHGQTLPSEHRRRHNIRLRKLIFPALLVLLALCGLFAWSCVNWYGWSTREVDSLVGQDFGISLSKSQYSFILFLNTHWPWPPKRNAVFHRNNNWFCDLWDRFYRYEVRHLLYV